MKFKQLLINSNLNWLENRLFLSINNLTKKVVIV
jgi:hypothetical protein